MTTTFEKFNGTQAGNYSSNPTIDVEILPDVHLCDECGEEILYNESRKPGSIGEPMWLHANRNPELPYHYVSAALRCRFCHAHEGVEYKQQAWSDETHCARCGGVDGFAIGD